MLAETILVFKILLRLNCAATIHCNLSNPVAISNQIGCAGYRGVFLESAASAFEADVRAIDLAIDFVKTVLQNYQERRLTKKRNI